MALTQVETSGLSGSGAASNSTTGNVFSQTGPFKNRIINGDMRIDQRNAGAAVTVNTANNFYGVDRFYGTGQATDGVFSIQQSTTAPSGFSYSLLATVTTADASVGATQQYFIGQNIEGFNVADLGWGSASARTVTVSFWVRSSLTGLFGGSFVNSAFNRSYPFSYTISAANTWEYKTIVVAGDTSGTWVTDNGVGIRVIFSLGAGSSYSGTAGAWSGSYLPSATGATSVVGTNGATFYITGVQLEAGTVATPFERRSYGQELALCQRYFQPIGTGFSGRCSSSSGVEFSVGYRVPMRANATVSLAGFSGAANQFDCFGTAGTQTIAGSFSSPISWTTGAYFSLSVSGTPLTTGAPAFLIRGDVASASAEL